MSLPAEPGRPATRTTQRLFVSIPLPAAIKAEVGRLAEPVAGVRWVATDQLHLTMRFLGDVESERQDGLAGLFRSIRVEPFLLPVEGVGAFPPRPPPHVVWVGIGSGHPRLFQLRQRLDDAVLAAGLEADLRTFHAHITVGRCQPGAAAGVGQWLKRHREFVAAPFRVEAFELQASRLRPEGAVHRLIERFPLG